MSTKLKIVEIVTSTSISCILFSIVYYRHHLKNRHHELILRSKSLHVLNIGYFFGLDIGGTLAKIVYFQKDQTKNSSLKKNASSLEMIRDDALEELEEIIFSSSTRNSKRIQNQSSKADNLDVEENHERCDDRTKEKKKSNNSWNMEIEDHLTMKSNVLGTKLHFIQFDTDRVPDMIQFMRYKFLHRYITKVPCTGGGAFKYQKAAQEKLGIQLKKYDELDCLIRGMNFLLKHSETECYSWKDVELDETKPEVAKKVITSGEQTYPFLLVNIGSGVSILKITGETEYQRVSGTSLGGGTFWGLMRLATSCLTFDESIALSLKGNSNSVDMSVGDIYGGDYAQLGLSSQTLASSFGKLGSLSSSTENIPEKDVALSLLIMITQNIGQVAYLNAQRYETPRVLFCGNFLRNNEIASKYLSYAIEYWSKGKMRAQFFEHEGFFGAVGALLSVNPSIDF